MVFHPLIRKSRSATRYAFSQAHLKSARNVEAFCTELLDKRRIPHLAISVTTIFLLPLMELLQESSIDLLRRALPLLDNAVTMVASFDERNADALLVWSEHATSIGKNIVELVLIGANHYFEILDYVRPPMFQ